MASISAEASSTLGEDKKGKGPGPGEVFQFYVRLVNTLPPVWRRVQVPSNYKFWGLHCVIQNSMGWNDTHLHCFEVKNPATGKFVKIGKPVAKKDGKFPLIWSVDEATLQAYMSDPKMLTVFGRAGITIDAAQVYASWKVPLTKYFTEETKSKFETEYTYDLEDNWTHEVIFEGIFQADPNKFYPACIGGDRACPPEDCQGTTGFDELLENLKKKGKDRTKNERERIKWLNDLSPSYSPDFFDPESIVFVSPKLWLEYKRSNAV